MRKLVQWTLSLVNINYSNIRSRNVNDMSCIPIAVFRGVRFLVEGVVGNSFNNRIVRWLGLPCRGVVLFNGMLYIYIIYVFTAISPSTVQMT